MENWDYEQEMMHRQFQGYAICELCKLREVSKKFLLIYMNITVILLIIKTVLIKLFYLVCFMIN
jgi:hypothetical protein